MKKAIRYIIIGLFALLPLASMAATNALLEKCATKVGAMPSVKIIFTVTASGKPQTYTLLGEKSKFTLAGPGVKVWYDGKTQWVYDAATQELSITEPDFAELLQINPFAILYGYEPYYNAVTPKGENDAVELQAKDRHSQIKTVKAKVNASNGLPSRVTVTTADGESATANISAITSGDKLPAKTFTYTPGSVPVKNTNDLR